jgi:SAM-dependent methyltransferase
MTDRNFSQLAMMHRLPPAPLVPRVSWLASRAAGQRVVHVGFVDTGCEEMQGRAGTWLHGHLATTAKSLIGLDVDAVGVEAARSRGYEAYEIDCRRPDDIRALELAPADVVLAGEVIEHLDDPGAFLDGLHELCAPGGSLILTTPNPVGLLNTFALLAGYEINHPDHVTMFTWRTLTNLMRRHRWETVETYVFVPEMKVRDRGTGGAVLGLGARFVLWLERTLARFGRPFAADGLIVVARPVAGPEDSPPAG